MKFIKIASTVLLAGNVVVAAYEAPSDNLIKDIADKHEANKFEDDAPTMDLFGGGNRSCLCGMSSNPQRCYRVVDKFSKCVERRAKHNVLNGRSPMAGCEGKQTAMTRMQNELCPAETFGGDNDDTCNCAMSSNPKRCKEVVANFQLCVAKHTRSNILQGRDRWVGCEDERATMDRMCTGETAAAGIGNRNRSCLCGMSSNPQRCNRVVQRFENCVRKSAKNNVLNGRTPFAGCENRRAAMERMQNQLCPAETTFLSLDQAAASCALRGFSLGATLVAVAAILIIH